mgnify:CR=1 FL=1
MSTIKTRSGRTVKKPARWEPKEDVIDDFGADEYNSDESDVSSEVEFSESEKDDDEASDDDSFINDDATNDDIECSSDEEEYVDESE